MRVLIYEPEHSGHHLADLSRMIPAIREHATEVIWATTDEALESDAFKATLEGKLDGVRVEPVCKRRGTAKYRFHLRCVLECSRLAKRFDADHVYLMMGDGKWQIIETFGLLGWRPFRRGVTSDTYLIRGGHAYPDAPPVTGRVKRFLFKRMMRRGSISSVLVLDEILAAEAERWAKPTDRGRVALSPAPMVPQPGLSTRDARDRLGLPQDRKLILMLGMIQRLRGADRVLNAYQRYRERHGDGAAALVLAGPHDESAMRLLSTPACQALYDNGSLFSRDEYLNDDLMFTFAAACDLMTVGTHKHTGRSSALVWAAANGKPVVTTDTGSIGWVVENTPLGWTCNVTDADDYASTLERALHHEAPPDRQTLLDYGAFHHIDNYRAVGTARLRERQRPDG